MRDEKISDFLAQLADRVPAPGGGASAALHAAQAAALLEGLAGTVVNLESTVRLESTPGR